MRWHRALGALGGGCRGDAEADQHRGRDGDRQGDRRSSGPEPVPGRVAERVAPGQREQLSQLGNPAHGVRRHPHHAGGEHQEPQPSQRNRKRRHRDGLVARGAERRRDPQPRESEYGDAEPAQDECSTMGRGLTTPDREPARQRGDRGEPADAPRRHEGRHDAGDRAEGEDHEQRRDGQVVCPHPLVTDRFVRRDRGQECSRSGDDPEQGAADAEDAPLGKQRPANVGRGTARRSEQPEVPNLTARPYRERGPDHQTTSINPTRITSAPMASAW